MESNIILKTNLSNNYFYNRKTHNIFLLHPVLKYILKLKNKGYDINNWISNIKDTFSIVGYKEFTKKEINYYYKKYKFLESNNQLEKFVYKTSFNCQELINIFPYFIAFCDDITFEVTERCNLNCKYCAYGENFEWFDKRGNKDLSFNKVKVLLDYFLKQAVY